MQLPQGYQWSGLWTSRSCTGCVSAEDPRDKRSVTLCIPYAHDVTPVQDSCPHIHTHTHTHTHTTHTPDCRPSFVVQTLLQSQMLYCKCKDSSAIAIAGLRLGQQLLMHDHKHAPFTPIVDLRINTHF